MASSNFAKELVGLYQPYTPWETKLFLGDLAARIADFDQSLPGSAKASHTLTSAFFDYTCEILDYVKEVSESLGIDTTATVVVDGETIDVYDFTCLNYEDFEDLVETTDDALKEIDLATIVPGWMQALGPNDFARKALAKLLAVLGVSEFYTAFLSTIEEGWGNILQALGEAIARRDWSMVRRLLKKLLDILISSEFFERLAARIGRNAAAKIVGKILAKFIPIVGWIWLIGSLIWAIAEEYI